MTNMLIFPLLFSSFFFSFGLRALKWCAARHVTPNEHRELHWWKTAQNHTKRAFAHVFISKMTVKKSNLSKSRKKVFDGSFEGAELPCVIIFAWFRIHLAVACETFSINRLFSQGRQSQKSRFFLKISRLRIFLAELSRFGGYIYHSKVPYESKGNLPQGNWVIWS